MAKNKINFSDKNNDDELCKMIDLDYMILTDKIYINFPTVREVMFDIGEKKYWSIIYSLVATSSDLIDQLDDKGLDWEKVPDFDIFIMNFLLMNEDLLNVMLPTIKSSNFSIILFLFFSKLALCLVSYSLITSINLYILLFKIITNHLNNKIFVKPKALLCIRFNSSNFICNW